jgi:hypothetical protein
METKLETKEEKDNEYICPITLEKLREPVFLVDDCFTYEKDSLVKWLEKNPKLSPMGFELKTRKFVPNRTFNNDFKCPILYDYMVDPVIIVESGMTYEHGALIKTIRESYCKNKKLGRSLGFDFGKTGEEKITVLPNKILWKDKNVELRKSFVMPPMKKYRGFVSSEIKEEIKNTVIHINDYQSVGKHSGNYGDPDYHKLRNKRYDNITFKSGCIKNRKLINCVFINCIFDRVCFCSYFKNCYFRDCLFIKPNIRGQLHLSGSSFSDCKMINPSVYKHDTQYVEYCETYDELKDNFIKRGALQVNIDGF